MKYRIIYLLVIWLEEIFERFRPTPIFHYTLRLETCYQSHMLVCWDWPVALRLNIRAGSILARTEKKATVELTEDRQGRVHSLIGRRPASQPSRTIWTYGYMAAAVAAAVAGGKPRTDWILRVWSEAGKNQCSVVTGLWLWEEDALLINFTPSTDNRSQPSSPVSGLKGM